MQVKSNSLDGMEEHQFGSSYHEYDPLRYELVFNLVEHPHIFLRLILYQVALNLALFPIVPFTFDHVPLIRLLQGASSSVVVSVQVWHATASHRLGWWELQSHHGSADAKRRALVQRHKNR